jgi:membrane protease YdiL (CAAX protease family)
MEDQMQGNPELGPPDIFSALNHYILLFFGLTCILSSVFIQQLFYMADQLRVGLVVAPVLGIILPVWAVTRRFPAGFRSQLLIARPRFLMTLYVLVATAAVIVIVDFIYAVSQQFLNPPADYVEGLKELKPTGVVPLVVTFLGICVLVPLAEEIVFRGLVQRIFSRNMGPVLAMFLAGAFFGVIHLTPQLLLSMIVFGIFLGYLFMATSNLVYPILAHALLNAFSYLQLLVLPEDQLASVPPYARDPWVLGFAVLVVIYAGIRIKKAGLGLAKTP